MAEHEGLVLGAGIRDILMVCARLCYILANIYNLLSSSRAILLHKLYYPHYTGKVTEPWGKRSALSPGPILFNDYRAS